MIMKMDNEKLKVSLAFLGLSCLANLFLTQPVSANMMQSKIGFTVHQDVRDTGVLPPEIPQNGQLVHYDLLPSTGSTQEHSLILFGCMIILFVAVFFLARRYVEKGKLE
ncbi:LPXTG cell wall anchor domain-containing protein [Lactococcus formosensis]|uniref:LPXTG cell wall anchor domain-containing protein n=1 Tax=Lactococcus formosensis TaxID=1281486 RepID=UPI0022E09AE4|nr:LPXTG cell wall anchor domain-containing protein [Lactococcus formosensis]